MADEPKVEISLKEIYDEFKGLSSDVRTLISKIDSGKLVDDDHEKRIRFIEKALWALPITAVVTAINAYQQARGK